RLSATAIALIAIALAALVFAPNQTTLLLSKPLLASTNITLKELQGFKISLRDVSFDRMVLLEEGNSAILTGAHISFQLTELFKGKLDRISVAQATIEIVEADSEVSANEVPVLEVNTDPQQLSELLTQASLLPFSQLEINSIQLSLDHHDIDAALSLAVAPLVLQFNALAMTKEKENQSFSLSGAISQISKQRIESSVQLQKNDQEFLRSDVELVLTNTGLKIAAQSAAQMPTLMNTLQEYLPVNDIVSASDFLSFSMLFSNDQAATNTINFELAVADQVPMVELTQQIEGAEVELLVPLLIPLTGNYDLATARLQLNLSDFDTKLTGNWGAGLVTANISFRENSASCMALIICQVQTSVGAISNIELGTGEKLEDFAASGLIYVSWANSSVQMTSDKVALSLPSIIGLDFKSPAKVEFTNISLEQDLNRQTFIARADYLADQISFENSIVEIDNLSVSGALSLAENTIQATTRLRIANQLTANTKLTHSFSSGQGLAEVALNDYSFSKITPLSKLFSLRDYNVELVAGTVSGHSEFQWRQSTEGVLSIEGPVNILLSDLSGYYDDLFFVGFTTAIDAEFVEAMNFRTAQPLQGEISTFDIGIPVSDIRWDYSWDNFWDYSGDTENSYSVIALDNLTAAILGGEVSVPSLRLDSRNSQSESNVVISNLNLETIVALAEYPGLHVDGFISGYLPISIAGSSITLSDGLISALNPGGTISYIPTIPASTLNSRLQLVNDALSDYRYDRLNTNVFYTENGDLTLAVQLQGFNPDMNQGQPINLNVNVTDNIPTLLKSLQASRSITDALEETLNNR
ncbi:MAG: hypothetical protein ACI85S_002957, partial [Pseudohongiellaceae bacterium]